jgi:hypothetical protein
MKAFEEIRKTLASHKSELQKRYKVKEIGIFGSYVKNEQKKTSDIDILVEFKETPTLIKFINLENYLSDLLGIKVDLVMKRALKPNIGKVILEEVAYI